MKLEPNFGDVIGMSIPELVELCLSDLDSDDYFWLASGILTAAVQKEIGMDLALELAHACLSGDKGKAVQKIMEMQMAGKFTGERRL